jgi:hypothetical protein
MSMPTGTSTEYDVNKKKSGILMILVSEKSPQNLFELHTRRADM